ncbi:MAG: hypothetical protein WCA30_19210 [Dermatophilaceae bacterium]
MPKGGERLSIRETRVVAGLSVALVAFGAWRVTVGADFGDGTHVVALAMRMAQGDLPLADEMNLQALGSITAVPFTWVWLRIIGVEGIVLAARLWYVLVAVGCAALAYRALRTAARPLPSLTAVVFMLLPTPYNLLVTSYNTMPVLAMGVATCCAFAALRGDAARAGRWAAVSGAALAVAVLSHPTSVGAAVTLGVAALLLGGGSGPLRRGLLAGAAGVSIVALAVVLAAIGPDAVRRTLEYTLEYQAQRLSPGERLLGALSRYGETLVSWTYAPAAVLALVAALVPRPWRAAVGCAAVSAVVLGVFHTVLEAPMSTSPFGAISPAFGMLVIPVLLAPVLVWAVRDDDVDLAVLLSLTAPAALVGYAVMTMSSSASTRWGSAAASFLPLLGILAYAVADQVGERPRAPTAPLRPAAAAALVLILALVGTHTLRTFRDPIPFQLDDRIATGPQAGLLTQERFVTRDCLLEEVTAASLGPGDGVLFYGLPTGYAYSEAAMDTNILWLSAFGAANAATLEWIRDSGRAPEVVIVGQGTVDAAGGWDRLVAADPFVAMVDAGYGPPVPSGTGYFVLRRDGTRAILPATTCTPPVR